MLIQVWRRVGTSRELYEEINMMNWRRKRIKRYGVQNLRKGVYLRAEKVGKGGVENGMRNWGGMRCEVRSGERVYPGDCHAGGHR